MNLTAHGELRRSLALAVVRDHPGACLRELERHTGLGCGALQHHLRILKRRRLVWYTRFGPTLLHFPGDYPGELAAMRAIRSAMAKRWGGPVLQAVLANPGLPQRDYLDAFPDAPRSSTQHRLRVLVRVGVLREVRHGRYLHYHPTDAYPLTPEVAA